MNVKIVTFGARQTAAAFAAAPTSVQRRVSRSVRSAGSFMRTRVRANVSGRTGVTFTDPGGGPSGEIGPKVQSGDYRRSISLATGRRGDDFFAEIFSNEPQGLRLELGFVGSDSLGRHFTQRALPHFRPAVAPTHDFLASLLESDIAAVDREVSGA